MNIKSIIQKVVSNLPGKQKTEGQILADEWECILQDFDKAANKHRKPNERVRVQT